MSEIKGKVINQLKEMVNQHWWHEFDDNDLIDKILAIPEIAKGLDILEYEQRIHKEVTNEQIKMDKWLLTDEEKSKYWDCKRFDTCWDADGLLKAQAKKLAAWLENRIITLSKTNWTEEDQRKQILQELQAVEENKVPKGNITKYLSSREKEVLGRMIEGGTNKEIADFLFITEQTVKNHITAIMIKLKAKNRVDAVVKVLRENE